MGDCTGRPVVPPGGQCGGRNPRPQAPALASDSSPTPSCEPPHQHHWAPPRPLPPVHPQSRDPAPAGPPAPGSLSSVQPCALQPSGLPPEHRTKQKPPLPSHVSYLFLPLCRKQNATPKQWPRFPGLLSPTCSCGLLLCRPPKPLWINPHGSLLPTLWLLSHSPAANALPCVAIRTTEATLDV